MQIEVSILSHETTGGCKFALTRTDMQEEIFSSALIGSPGAHRPQHPALRARHRTLPPPPPRLPAVPHPGEANRSPRDRGFDSAPERRDFPPSRHTHSPTRESFVCTLTSVAYFLTTRFGTRSTARRGAAALGARTAGSPDSGSRLSPSRSLRRRREAPAPSHCRFLAGFAPALRTTRRAETRRTPSNF